jgi:hypothetical protein
MIEELWAIKAFEHAEIYFNVSVLSRLFFQPWVVSLNFNWSVVIELSGP